jgi:hypothetical protein
LSKFLKKVRKKLQRWSARADAWLLRRIQPPRPANFPPVMLVSLPKSGSVYLQTALRRTLRVPMVKFDAGGTFDSSLRIFPLKEFARGNALTRLHMPPRPYLVQAIADSGVSRMLVLIRDPREAIHSWARHVDRNLAQRGLGGALIDVETALPPDFAAWSERRRLEWQIEHMLPRFCDWLQGWADIAESAPIKIGFVDFADMPQNERAFLGKVLKFFDITCDESWLYVPKPVVGQHNISSLDAKPSTSVIDPDLVALINAKVPDKLLQRFGWQR